MEKVKVDTLAMIRAQPLVCEGQLPRWREMEDAALRAENLLLRYYLRTCRPRKEFIPEVMVA